MRFYRVKAVLLAVVLVFGTCGLSGCGGYSAADDGKLKIVCTTFPQYDWVRQIVGGTDGVEIELLLRNGVDMHSYQPTVEDMYKIATADVFVYVGGESDTWVESALKNVRNDDIQVVNMMETIGDAAKVEELVEGMQDDEHSIWDNIFSKNNDDTGHVHGNAQGSDGSSSDDEDLEYDEHMWLSISNAVIITTELAETIAKLDAANADKYTANAKSYIKKLNDLDGEFRETVAKSLSKTVLFGDRFPFRYLADEYGLEYYAAFPGCSAETEASFETVVYLAGKVDEIGLGAIFVIENSDRRVADAIRRNTKNKNQEILTLNSMQSVSDKDIAAGVSYISIMEDNLAVLRKGL